MEKASRGYGQGLWWGFEGEAATVELSGRRREEIYSGVDEWRTVGIGGACAISIAQAVCVSASVVCEMSESAETRRILLKRKISVSSGHKAKRTAETRISTDRWKPSHAQKNTATQFSIRVRASRTSRRQ